MGPQNGTVFMGKQNQVGIPVDGGVITFEPSISKAKFWMRETIYNLVNPGHYGRRFSTPLYVVIWNADRTIEFYREGPYGNEERGQRTKQLRAEIGRDGLEEFLFKKRSPA
jgi:hypothetical protein